MRILRVLDPDYTEEEVLYLSTIDPSLPQATWLIANTIFFISSNRERCDATRYRAILSSESEILQYSRHVDPETLCSFKILVDLLGNMDEIVNDLN